MPEFGAHLLHRIERDRILHVRRIKIDHVVQALFGNEVQKFLGGFAVRVEERDAASGLDVRDRHVLEERRLSDAGLSHHVYVAAAIVKFDAKLLVGVAAIIVKPDRRDDLW